MVISHLVEKVILNLVMPLRRLYTTYSNTVFKGTLGQPKGYCIYSANHITFCNLILADLTFCSHLHCTCLTGVRYMHIHK